MQQPDAIYEAAYKVARLRDLIAESTRQKPRPVLVGALTYGQMPANGPPFFTDTQIQEIAAWIDAGCPQ
jgi:hypothetical protein